jgi:hypothetical protein
MKQTLFLQAPSFDGFDGGAGSRYQAKREVRSFWYPTWLAQPAALVPGSRVLDAPADGLSFEATLDIAARYELVVIHTSTPSFPTDALFAEQLKARAPHVMIGLVGAKVAVDPHNSLAASDAIDFACREEFDYTCKEIAEGQPLAEIKGLSYRLPDGSIEHNEARPILENMDELPFVAPVYQRDLNISNYFIGYLNYPYVSIYTGRGCRSRCTFCLWPQTVGGHRYRVRSVENVLEEVKWIRDNMPEVKEIMFDDDTFTDFKPRVEEIARGLGKLGVTWSCNAKGKRTLLHAQDHEGERPAPAARGLRIRRRPDPPEHQEGPAHGYRATLRRRLPQARHQGAWHVHSRPAGRDEGHDRKDHSVREGNQPAHDPGVARRALSRHDALPAGSG